MTKSEARQWIRRIREDLRDAEEALRNGDGEALVIAMQDAAGSAAEIENAVLDGNINGINY